MLNRKKYVLWWATASVCLWTVAHVGGQAPQQSRPQGWAVRQSLNNPNAPLYNNVKQKLLDGKQVATFAINRPDTKLYCEAAKHYDYIWFEMQHSTMSFKDIEEMIAACPRPVATPVIRVPDETEGNIQKATDIGALGVVIPTVDTPEKAMLAARYARYPPDGRRSVGAGQATSIWGVNGINYRDTINDNMLVIVQVETPIGAWNSYAIANQPGIDVVLASNGDMSNFSGYQPTDPQYQLLFTQIHDGVLKAGKFLGAVTYTYGRPGAPGTGRPDSADWRLFYTGPSFDGWQAPRPTAVR
ncbi:MAG TPA: aldolase/citrate lyase family protein [Vicinamibacterales bacterium]